MSESNLQLCIQKARYEYEGHGQPPLIEQLCLIHGVTQREFATIFGISKGHAEKVIKHQVFPSLELGIRIARYWECGVEELFGWRVDDDGSRRPLLIVDRKAKKVRRLNAAGKVTKALDLVREGVR